MATDSEGRTDGEVRRAAALTLLHFSRLQLTDHLTLDVTCAEKVIRGAQGGRHEGQGKDGLGWARHYRGVEWPGEKRRGKIFESAYR